MTINGSYNLQTDQKQAYSMLQDPEILARCMPGCDRLTLVGEDEYEMKMKMMIASISGLFDGKVRIADRDFPSGFRLIVEGKGKIGFMKGEGRLTLIPNGSSTSVNYDGEVQVGGTMASVGQRLMDTTARMVIKRFFDKLTAEAAAQAASS